MKAVILFPTLLKTGKPILSYPSDAYWIDIGTPEKYLKAHHDLLLRWGEGTVLWEGVQVGEETVLRDCVIGSCAHIGSRCHIPDDCVLGDDVKVGKESNLASGTRLSPNSYVDPIAIQNT